MRLAPDFCERFLEAVFVRPQSLLECLLHHGMRFLEIFWPLPPDWELSQDEPQGSHRDACWPGLDAEETLKNSILTDPGHTPACVFFGEKRLRPGSYSSGMLSGQRSPTFWVTGEEAAAEYLAPGCSEEIPSHPRQL